MKKLLFLMLLVPLIKADIKNIAYEYEKVLQTNIPDNSEIYMFSDSYYSTIEMFEEKIDFWRLSASVMGMEAYRKASKQQKIDFMNTLKSRWLATLADVSIEVLNNAKLISVEKSESADSPSQIKMVFKNNKRKKIPVAIIYRGDGSSNIVNIIFNTVNLGLSYRLSFQAYYEGSNKDISKTIYNFESGASLEKSIEKKADNLLANVFRQVIKDYPQAKLNARLRKEAYNRGVNDGYRNGKRKNGGVAPLPNQ